MLLLTFTLERLHGGHAQNLPSVLGSGLSQVRPHEKRSGYSRAMAPQQDIQRGQKFPTTEVVLSYYDCHQAVHFCLPKLRTHPAGAYIL